MNLIESIKKDLMRLKVLGGGRKEETDLFVVGTVEIKKHHPKVQYNIYQGVKETCDKIADFVLNPAKAVRKWEAFARVKTQIAAEKQVKIAKAKSIEGRVDLFKLSKAGKKTKDDAFVVGTADMRLSTLEADVRFRVISGVKAVADFLLDYVLAAPENVKRQWHVFYRAKTEEEANKFVEQLRADYDAMESQCDRSPRTTARRRRDGAEGVSPGCGVHSLRPRGEGRARIASGAAKSPSAGLFSAPFLPALFRRPVCCRRVAPASRQCSSDTLARRQCHPTP